MDTTTFKDSMRLPVHRWFRYSAGFSADWAVSTIKEFEATRVLDPFSGSGTTIIAAEQCKVEGVGIDIHPFVGEVARAKLEWRLDPHELITQSHRLVSLAHTLTPDPPTSDFIHRCFPDTRALMSLLQIRDALNATSFENLGYSRLLWLALVSILRVCSPVGTAQWQYILPNQRKAKVVEPYQAFESRVELFAQDMRYMQERCRESPPGLSLHSDARTLEGIPTRWKADLVLTSPPYANNYDYADATRLEQTFLGTIEGGWGDLKPLRQKLVKSATQNVSGWDPQEALESSHLSPIVQDLLPVYHALGEVKKTKGGNKAYDTMIVGYFYDLAQTWEALRRSTSSSATVCFVVGDSAPYGVHVPVERWLGELALATGFDSWRFEKVRDRNVKWKNRTHTVPLHEGRLWVT